jgi:hypothetical protein
MVLVDEDPQAKADYLEVEQYIKEEVRVVELKVEQNENEYVGYKCSPDNKLIGSVLKKAFDKDFKKKISSLSSQ